ncbi:MAG: TonB-dependent receptor [Bacteroidota bacterium]
MCQLFTTLSTLCLLTTMSLAQGTITGKVMDDTGTTLPSANVYIENAAAAGTTTDLDGEFVLTGVPEGTQTLIISYIGFEESRTQVEVAKGEVVQVNVKLSAGAVLSKEVIITGQALGQAKAINQQLNAESIANIVSADRIQELPDVNAAEAIGRLPGIALNRSGGEGQKVVIRGMEPKFAAITLNGVSLPSNSGTDRSTDLSLISPELLDGIEVFKSPLPDMDAEAVGGTVNLRLRKAPEELKVIAKGLYGFNALNNEFRDYKGTLQMSQRIFNKKLGVVGQASIERFNRGGDVSRNSWRQGPTDQETGITDILGNQLRLEDRQEIRRRYNASLGLDYSFKTTSLSFFGLYSRTDRDRYLMQQRYNPGEPAINYSANSIENTLDLYSLSLSGEHTLGRLVIDWSLSSSETQGQTPYNFNILFEDNSNAFDPNLQIDGSPQTYLGAAQTDLPNSFLRSNSNQISSTLEQTNTALLNLKLPFAINKVVDGYFKFGGKYKQIDRNRDLRIEAEDFYYLGGQFTRTAIARYGGDLTFLPANDELISILSFLNGENNISFEGKDSQPIDFVGEIDPETMYEWYESQQEILNDDRSAIVENYEVEETVSAGYAMFKVNVGKKLSIIPGVRLEYSDNVYNGGVSTINGRYGVQGFFQDTTTTQTYAEWLPHLHLKYEPADWLDIRASYATTLARPDFLYITPRIQIDNNRTVITAGNPNLNYARSQNYDLQVSAYKGGFGLFSAGVFYKDIANLFYPFGTLLADQATADQFGFPNNTGFVYNSFTNSDRSTVYGFEVDLQTNLRFLPAPFDGLVLNANYSRLYSETEVFFFTIERRLIIPVPPVFETIVNNTSRTVQMPSQPPHIFNGSLGYDLGPFSARVSCIYQGTRVNTYSSNKDFDTFILNFWRWDASAKYKIGDHWSLFANLNNISNQQDISFTRTEQFLNTVETYGMTGTMGVQFKL